MTHHHPFKQPTHLTTFSGETIFDDWLPTQFLPLISQVLYCPQSLVSMKVLLINNYPMDHAWDLWQRGEYPGHHLWGATHLKQHDIEVDILPYQKFKLLNKIGRKLGLGDHLEQQIRILFHPQNYDVVYSACQTNTFLLALLRSLHLFRKPIVALIHHPLGQSALQNALFLHGHDQLLCLSSTVMHAFPPTSPVVKKIDYIEWGADLAFYDAVPRSAQHSAAKPLIISAGKTERDHDTLVSACCDLDCALKIYCSAATAPTVANLPPHIEICASTSTNNAVSYQTVLAAYRQATAIAIPLTKTDNLAGLTSLLDAMAVGKPVVMTRNKQVDIDIEQEGIGIWVDPGDVEGWQQAITYVLDHPDEARAMGDRGRELCEKKYSLEIFTRHLANALNRIAI